MSTIGMELTKATFNVVLPELYAYLKSRINNIQIKRELDIKEKFRKASDIEKVKTIWQVDKSVNLNNFYCSPRISIGQENDIEVQSLSDFPPEFKGVIEGTAGQGKSIFLRYLAGKELKVGRTIPIFVELRKVSDTKSLKDLILDNLSELGIEIDESYINILFESRKITLLLDAFDEISEDYVSDTLNYIEHLSRKFSSELKIIITSRPEHGIQASSFFDVYYLCPLVEDDFPKILDKFYSCRAESKTEEIINALDNSKNGIKEVLVTPLLLTMLTITYNSYQKIPDDLPEFYNNIFNLLANRHDETKPGYQRQFYSNLNEHDLGALFSCFSFLCQTRKERGNNFDFNTAVTLAKEAIELEDCVEANAVGFIRDSVKNTCLLVKDGHEYHFIHRSIMEYFSAKFLFSDAADHLRTRFFDKCSSSNPFRRYNSGVLHFCKNVSEHKYIDEYRIPLLKKVINHSEKEDYLQAFLQEAIAKTNMLLAKNNKLIGFSGKIMVNSITNEYDDIIYPFGYISNFFRNVIDMQKLNIEDTKLGANKLYKNVKLLTLIENNPNLIDELAFCLNELHEEKLTRLRKELDSLQSKLRTKNKKLREVTF